METDRKHGLFKITIDKISNKFSEIKWKIQMHPKKLESLPDERIKEIVPLLQNENLWRIEDDCLLEYIEKEDSYALCKQFNQEDTYILGKFLTKKPILSVVKLFSDQFNTNDDTAYKKVRDLFLYLADLGVFLPQKNV